MGISNLSLFISLSFFITIISWAHHWITHNARASDDDVLRGASEANKGTSRRTQQKEKGLKCWLVATAHHATWRPRVLPGWPSFHWSQYRSREREMDGVARSITLCCTRDTRLFYRRRSFSLNSHVCRQKERGIKAKSGTKNIISFE